MILPQMLYCSNIMLVVSNTHKAQFERIRNRVCAIINGNSQRVKLQTVNHARNTRCLVDVFKCQKGLAPRLFEGYFKKIQHRKETRGNNISLLLPKVRTEAGRKSFLFQGSVLFNKLPNAFKREQSIVNFKRQCDQLDCDFSFQNFILSGFVKLELVIWCLLFCYTSNFNRTLTASSFCASWPSLPV